MRLASLLVLLLTASQLFAQQAPSAPPAAPAASCAQAAPAPAPAQAAPPGPQPAPPLGHPLDPADVATLTSRPAAYAPANPYYYPPYLGSYPADTSLLSGHGFFHDRGVMPFSALAFGRFHGGPFLFFGNSGFGGPLFFFPGGHGFHGGFFVFGRH